MKQTCVPRAHWIFAGVGWECARAQYAAENERSFNRDASTDEQRQSERSQRNRESRIRMCDHQIHISPNSEPNLVYALMWMSRTYIRLGDLTVHTNRYACIQIRINVLAYNTFVHNNTNIITKYLHNEIILFFLSFRIIKVLLYLFIIEFLRR